MLEIKNKQTVPRHCCQSKILHLLFLLLMRSADNLGDMFSVCRTDYWYDMKIWYGFLSFLRSHITSQDVTSTAADTCFACCFQAGDPSQSCEPACSVPLLWIHLQHHFSSQLRGFPWTSALSICNQALSLSIYMEPATPHPPPPPEKTLRP